MSIPSQAIPSKTRPTPQVVLVDGSSYLFRAFHVMPELTTQSGQQTGTVKGVINMIRRLERDYPQSQLLIVFDARGKNFRHAMYPDYKANRPPMPETLAVQIAPIHQIIQAMGLPLLMIDGVEADDVIGTLAQQASEQGVETLISTGDKDMAQLVSAHVTLINTMTDTHMDADGVMQKFGVRPDQIIDYLALVGDTVDNIPGVPSCGPKTAAKWLAEYQTLDRLMAQADQIGGKIGEKLRDALDTLPLSRALATIKLDVALPHPLTKIHSTAPDLQALNQLYEQLEFRGWAAELQTPSAPEVIHREAVMPQAAPLHQESLSHPTTQTETPPAGALGLECSRHFPDISTIRGGQRHYRTLTQPDEWQAWLARLRASKVFAVDTETTSLSTLDARIVGLSFALQAGEAVYVPLMHDYMGAPEQLPLDQVLAEIKPLLEDPAYGKIGQNLKYDMHVFANHGIQLRGIADDTMLASYVLNSVATRHDMDSLAALYLDETTIRFSDIAGKGVKQLTFNQIDLSVAGPYAAEDADITLRLNQVLQPKLAATGRLQQVYREIDMPLVPLLCKIERNGARIDAGLLKVQSQQLAERMAEIEQQAFNEAGKTFNLASPAQLQEILYQQMGLPVVKKTPKGAPSTAEPVLQELAAEHALPRLILEHRSMSKLKSTYTDRLPEMINAGTGRVHTSYHQAVAATGRLSSSDPNLQNIPIRSPEGRRIRQAFIAEPGKRLLAADYSQIELRIMAHLSEDAGLLKAFAQGEDIHRATAAEVFGIERDQVSGDQRRSAKAINFGLIYGMSAFGLAQQLGIGRDLAKQYIDRYFDRYPGVLRYMERIRRQAHADGFVETLFGRRLYLPDINHRNKGIQQAAERTAINAPMQGTAADIIKRAMITVDDWLSSSQLDALIIMQVHDELVLEVAAEQVEVVREGLIQRMSQAATLAVPLLVEAGVGQNWDEAH